MKIKKLLVDFVSVFAVSLIVCASVTLLWNLIVHGASTIDWEASFRFAIVFGIILSWMETRRSKEKHQSCAGIPVKSEASGLSFYEADPVNSRPGFC